MKILKYVKLKDNRYKLILDNDTIVTLYDDVIVKYNLLINKHLDEEQLEEIEKFNEYMKAYYEALKYIAKKLRTKKEIKKNLEKKYNEKIIDFCIDKLEKEKYINNKLYIECFINDQVNLGNNGPLKIRTKLKDLGYKEEEIDFFLDKVNESIWEEKIKKIVNKKLSCNHKLGERKLKEKINYDLINLGYSNNLINKYLNFIKVNDNDILEKEYNKLLTKLSRKYEGKELEYYLTNKLLNKGFKYEDIKKVNRQD